MLNKIYAEIYKNYISIKRYPIEVAGDFILYILIFLAIYYSSKGYYSDLAARNRQVNRLIMTYTSWVFLSGILNHISNNVTKEMALGTINQVVLCDLNLASTFIIRSLVYALRLCFFIIPFTVFEFWITGSKCMFDLRVYYVLITMSIGALGLSLLMGGLILRYKSIGKLTMLISILFLGTTLFDIRAIFSQISYVKYIFPFIEGQQLLKDITLGNSIGTVSYVLLAVNALIYFAAGVALFDRNYKKVRLYGELSKI